MADTRLRGHGRLAPGTAQRYSRWHPVGSHGSGRDRSSGAGVARVAIRTPGGAPAETAGLEGAHPGLFSRITTNWGGRPLETYQTIVSLIANTATTTGLTVRADLDLNEYHKDQAHETAEGGNPDQETRVPRRLESH